MNKVVVYWIDLFCGAGGTTTGISQADANATVVACVNHDEHAIACHTKNHPNCLHFTEDITDFAVILKLKDLVKQLRRDTPNCVINIWASLECTHFSKAKGGLSRDADSRTLAKHLFRYVKHLDPNYLYIENVREFLSWGPLDDDGKPIKELKGIDYNDWRDTLVRFGYNYDYDILNAADYGAHTSRERYFGIFSKAGLPIMFPKKTHGKKGTGLKPWKTVREVLDLTNHGRSIFGLTKMGKIYSVKTVRRIEHGFHKFSEEITLSGGEKRWILDTQFSNKGKLLDQPGQTLIARMDKKPLYLITTMTSGEDNSKILPTDSPDVVSIKTVMAEYGIVDVKIRELTIKELKAIQGFPDSFELIGTMANKKKFIGNSVVPLVAKKLVESNFNSLLTLSA
tara:strand:- start:518 stop:1708 length:1191 start_codon:yes stop_codon:yes gene_type:complete